MSSATLLIAVGQPNGAKQTTNGGASWTSIGDAGNASVVPSRQPSNQVLSGSSAGVLSNSSTPLHTFPAAVSSIYTNPANLTRLSVGLANGDLWRSLDSGATWTLIASLGSRLVQVHETDDADRVYVVSGSTIWTIQTTFPTPLTWAAFAPPVVATRLVLGTEGSYAGGSDGTVLNVTTGAILAGPTSPILGLAYNPRHATLWVLEQNGKFWRMKTTETVLTNLSTVPGGGGQIAPVSAIPGLILTTNALGAWVSPDAGQTWVPILSGACASIGWYTPPTLGSY